MNPQNEIAGTVPHADTFVQATSDLAQGRITATVEIAAAPERVFRALTSEEICNWWVRPGVFDTRQWTGDVRVGGRWQAAGVGKGGPYALEGEFLEVDPPTKLVHTWRPAGAPMPPTVATFLLEKRPGATRLTLQHSGFVAQEVCTNTCIGWETSFERLAEMLAAESVPSP
jgi:uncharacterized protein YndB with AHSA1/START domain